MKLKCAAAKVGRLNLDGRRLMRADAGDEAKPQWNMLMPIGEWHRADFPKGGIKVDAALVSKFVANWKANGSPALPVDYHHEEGDIASGWIESLEARDDGLWGQIGWTKTARAHIVDDEYRYLSPTFALESTDRRSGKPQGPWLYGAALLNDPFFDSMPRVAASVIPDSTQPPTASVAKEQHLNRKLLCARLGLAEDATDEQINAALEKFNASVGVDEAKLKAAIAPFEAARAITEKALTAAQTENTALTARVVALEAAKTAVAVDALQQKLLSEGRITAAQQADVAEYAAAMGIEKATAFYAKQPQVVAVGERGVGSKGAGGETVATATAKITAAMGELMKASPEMKSADARIRAMEMHPELLSVFTDENTNTAPTRKN